MDLGVLDEQQVAWSCRERRNNYWQYLSETEPDMYGTMEVGRVRGPKTQRDSVRLGHLLNCESAPGKEFPHPHLHLAETPRGSAWENQSGKHGLIPPHVE